MSEDRTPSAFKIKMDSEPEESPCFEDFKEKREEQPGRKIALAPILILCLIGAAFLAGYLDLKTRISGLQHVGAQQSQNISETLESRFSALSIKQAALEEAMAKNIPPLQSALSDIREDLKKSQALLDQTAAAKADRKEVGQIQADLKTSFSDLNAAVKNLEESRIAPIYTQLSKLDEELKSSRAKIVDVEADFSNLSKNQISPKQAAAQIAASENKMLETIAKLRSALDAAVKSLEIKIQKAVVSGIPQPITPAPGGADPQKTADSAPSPESIVEENLP